METFDLYELILCVSEGLRCKWMRIHNVGMEKFDLHELILCVSEGLLSVLLCIHIGNIDGSWAPYSNFVVALDAD